MRRTTATRKISEFAFGLGLVLATFSLVPPDAAATPAFRTLVIAIGGAPIEPVPAVAVPAGETFTIELRLELEEGDVVGAAGHPQRFDPEVLSLIGPGEFPVIRAVCDASGIPCPLFGPGSLPAGGQGPDAPDEGILGFMGVLTFKATGFSAPASGALGIATLRVDSATETLVEPYIRFEGGDGAFGPLVTDLPPVASVLVPATINPTTPTPDPVFVDPPDPPDPIDPLTASAGSPVPRFSTVAVAKNGVPIEPTTEVDAQPGDTVEVELQLELFEGAVLNTALMMQRYDPSIITPVGPATDPDRFHVACTGSDETCPVFDPFGFSAGGGTADLYALIGAIGVVVGWDSGIALQAPNRGGLGRTIFRVDEPYRAEVMPFAANSLVGVSLLTREATGAPLVQTYLPYELGSVLTINPEAFDPPFVPDPNAPGPGGNGEEAAIYAVVTRVNGVLVEEPTEVIAAEEDDILTVELRMDTFAGADIDTVSISQAYDPFALEPVGPLAGPAVFRSACERDNFVCGLYPGALNPLTSSAPDDLELGMIGGMGAEGTGLQGLSAPASGALGVVNFRVLRPTATTVTPFANHEEEGVFSSEEEPVPYAMRGLRINMNAPPLPPAIHEPPMQTWPLAINNGQSPTTSPRTNLLDGERFAAEPGNLEIFDLDCTVLECFGKSTELWIAGADLLERSVAIGGSSELRLEDSATSTITLDMNARLVVEGGTMETITARGDSRLLMGGCAGLGVDVFERAEVTLAAGQIQFFNAAGGTTRIDGGNIDVLTTSGHSTIERGSVGQVMVNGGFTGVMGGSVDTLTCTDGRVELSGGDIGTLRVDGCEARVFAEGTEPTENGVRGTWPSGEPMELEIELISGTALVPEPNSLLAGLFGLLALCGLCARRRPRIRG